MGKPTVVAGALALAFAAAAEKGASPAPAQNEGGARKHLADFFLRTKGTTRVVTASELLEDIRGGKTKYRIVDVRPVDDYEKGHLPGAINVPLDVLFRPESLELLQGDRKPLLLVCQSGHMESMALGGLAALGYEPYVLRFGMIGWNSETKVKAAGVPHQQDVVHGVGGPLEK
ncbi:MAG TPA: rhodanese-like domain-containing protein [Myxococcales bacterium]|nr:rhodanese-like domain-containing protein [Myxococcales bacterium]